MNDSNNEENEYIRFKILEMEFVIKKITKGTIQVISIIFIFILSLVLIFKMT